MEILTFELPPLGTNAYCLVLPQTKTALLVDAPQGVLAAVTPVLEERGLTLAALLLTHGHFDHMLGLAEVNAAGVPVYAHPADRELIENPSEQLAFFGMTGGPVSARVDNWVSHGQRLDLGMEVIEVRHVPGHCPGSVLFHFPQRGVAFVGDAVFCGGIGRCDLPGGSFDQLARSIREQIYSLPDATTLYPGHGQTTTVAAEKAANPFVPGLNQ